MSSVFHRRNSCVFDDRTLILFLCELILICLWVVFSFSINMLVNRSWKYILDSIDISSQILFYPNPHKASNTINMSCFKAHKNMWHCELTKYKWKKLLLFFFFFALLRLSFSKQLCCQGNKHHGDTLIWTTVIGNESKIKSLYPDIWETQSGKN